MLLWLAILLAAVTDLAADDDPTLLAACSFENDPIELTDGGTAVAAVAVAKSVLKSSEGVFSPNSQYVVTFPLPWWQKKNSFLLPRCRTAA